jgi:hypothetical protein
MTFTKKIAAHEEKLGKKKKREREKKNAGKDSLVF